MKLQKISLALLLPLFLPIALQAKFHQGDEYRRIVIPTNSTISIKEWRSYLEKFIALDHEFQEANVLPFTISEASEGMVIPVKLHDIFKIAFLLPDDTDGGLRTHMVLAPQLVDFENPIQGWEDHQAMLFDACGNNVDLSTFYVDTDTSGKPHPPELQSGVTSYSSYIANQVGTYPLTFTLIKGVWKTDLFKNQYCFNSIRDKDKKITIYIQVVDDE